MKILSINKDLAFIEKAVGEGSQPDKTTGCDVMSALSSYLKAHLDSPDVWLVHRLDRVVGGVMVYARNKKYAAILSQLASGEGFNKEYYAVVEGEAEGGRLCDLLYKDAQRGKAFVVDRKRVGVKEAVLDYVPLERRETEKGVRTLVKISLLTGRFHQIRTQFSARGTPLVGDGKYGSRDAGAKTPALYSVSLSFEISGRKYSALAYPPSDEYPWSLFSSEHFMKGEN